MTDLTGKLIANTYKDILTVDTSTTNSGLDNNLRKVQDGAGNSSSLKLSQTDAAFTGNVSVNGNMTVEGTFQPNTINTSQLDAVNISATNITTDTLTAGTLTFQDVSVSSLRTGDLYAATISAGTISATNINATNITVGGDNVATSSALASVNDALVSIEAVVSSNIVFVLNAQASVLAVLAGLSATDTNLQNNINSVSATLSATDVQVQINANQIATLATSIAANASAIAVNTSSIAVNSAAITSINSFISAGAFASAGTSATLETRIASASATLESHINTVSATLSSTNIALQTSIANSNSAIAALSATMATSINNSNSAIAAVSSTMATSINNSNTAIAANTSLITALSATLESRIATVSSTMATSIAAVSSTLEGRIASVSAALATSIASNTSSIAINTTNIAANTSSIAVNATNIAANTSSIAANTSSININTTSIAANASAIAVNTGNISTNTTNIAANTSSIAVNASNITTLSATLETRIATVSSTMATSINNSNAAITSVNTRINSVSVLAETKASAATSANLETRINAVSVLTQTNKTSIAANASAIAVLQGLTYASVGTSATLESRIAAVSLTMATSIANSNSAIATLSTTMATSIANHLPLAGGTMTGNLILNADPTVNLGAATKQYVDNLTASGIHFHEAVRLENPGNLTATYNNGAAGVGATLTNAGTQTALVVDGVAVAVDDRILIYEQTDQTQNGVYVVTDIGSGSTNWVLTRSADTDSYGSADATTLDEGSYFFVTDGDTGAGESYICNTAGVITFGTTNITFVQFSSSLQYTAGTGININASRVISTSGVATAAQVATLSATLATSIANVSATLESRIATVSALIPTSLTELGITDGTAGQYLQTNANGTYSFTSVAAGGAGISNITAGTNIALTQNGVTVTDTTTSATINVVGVASAGTSAALETRIASVSSAMATSIANSNAAITSVNTRINSVSVLAETKASAATSANLATRINSVSVLAETKASAATSANLETRIAAVSVLTQTNKTSIAANASAITVLQGLTYASVGTSAALETRINSVSVLAETKASAATSANLQTRINAVSATMATSIANVSSALGSRITTLSATMATSISNKVSKSGDTMTGDLLMDSSNAEINIKAGNVGTAGRINWTFDTTTTNYASLSLPYDTRATTGFHMDVGYPITIDATTQINFDIAGVNKGTLNSSGNLALTGTSHTAGGNTIWHAGNDGAGSGLDADTVDGVHESTFMRKSANSNLDMNNFIISDFDYLEAQGEDRDVKLGVWAGNTYGIGMRSAVTYGGLNDFAMTFCMNNDSDRGFWWGYNGQSKSTGAMSLTTSGILTVASTITAGGNITAFSDERLKSDIETLDGSKVYEMRGVSFTKDGAAGSGVIAQELQKVAPELVNDSGEYLSVAYGNLVGYLIEAVKELKAEVEQLKSEK